MTEKTWALSPEVEAAQAAMTEEDREAFRNECDQVGLERKLPIAKAAKVALAIRARDLLDVEPVDEYCRADLIGSGKFTGGVSIVCKVVKKRGSDAEQNFVALAYNASSKWSQKNAGALHAEMARLAKGKDFAGLVQVSDKHATKGAVHACFVRVGYAGEPYLQVLDVSAVKQPTSKRAATATRVLSA